MKKERPMRININDNVYVKLTAYGQQIIRDYNDGEETAIEYSGKFQLWRLMVIFGEHLHMGMNEPLFENNIISTEPITRKEQ